MATELEIQTPDSKKRNLPLEPGTLSLGRAHSNDLCYPDDVSLSRRHLQLEGDDGGWYVTDLGSKNGTLLNGSRITGKQRLKGGDRLSAGQILMTFADGDSPPSGSVIFVPEVASELNPGATVMTSLEGVLSAETTGHGLKTVVAADSPLEVQETFRSPIVKALIRAGRELSGRQPLEDLFNLILELSIEAVQAERGVLMTLEGDDLVPRALHGGEGFRISRMVRDRVLGEKTSLLVKDIRQEEALRQQLSISEQQIHSLMAVPLQTEERVIGLVYVDSRLFVREFTPNDLNLLTVLANVAAIRIEHARFLRLEALEQRRTRDLEQAAEIQRGILPKGAPAVAGFDLAGHNAPSRTVGGDYYDFIPFEDGSVSLVLGDVAGKGFAAALLMSALQARVQLLTEQPAPLDGLMSQLDKSLATRCPSNRFITLFLCHIDPATGSLHYCNAGHNPPLLMRAAGGIEELDKAGTVLGILPEIGYEQHAVRLEPGDLLAVFSDGVTEAANPDDEEFGQERLAEILLAQRDQPAEKIVEAVNAAVEAFTREAPQADDITLLIARYVG